MKAPSASRDWPVEVRRYLTHLTLQRALDLHDGSWQELAIWLYAGQTRPDGERLPFSPTVDFIWDMILTDAAAWQQARTAAPLDGASARGAS